MKIRLFGLTTDDENIVHYFDKHSQAISWLAIHQEIEWQFVYINPVPTESIKESEVPC